MEQSKRLWDDGGETTERYSPSPNSVDSGFESGPSSPDSSSCSSETSSTQAKTEHKVERYDNKIVDHLSTIKEEQFSVKSEIKQVKAESPTIPVASPELPEKAKQPSTSRDYYDADYHCLWQGCNYFYADVNDLYDHALQTHISVLPALPFTNGRKRRNSDACERHYQCKWHDCEMTLKRGAADKKFEWLSSHFRARHAPKAQPFKCLLEDCKLRFNTPKALHGHLRNSHDDKKKPCKKCPSPNAPKASCFTYKPRTTSHDYCQLDFMDNMTYDKISERLDLMLSLPKVTVSTTSTGIMPPTKKLNVLQELFPHKF
ncbi:unnamed protein product [Bursaphelenchus okinawaensis]|uniref:C2H2-type domain-containing protein n=1 Tax=Bursaphelenchus okinawaensis TaxID=465554 RepID=A0A811K8E5_9BILA|nr:unnamed protein product [Bursaphelenchus okinawaensis]CAG9094948.1 unnamed protein product [Bursaphelenchus okinawaensis]